MTIGLAVLMMVTAMCTVSPVTARAAQQQPAPPTGTIRQAVTERRGGWFPVQLTVFNRDGSVRSTVGQPDDYGEPMLSPDGTHVAATVRGLICIHDLRSGARTELMPIPPAEPRHLAWSPDGKRLAFVGNQGGRFGLYSIAVEGSGPAEVLYRGAAGEPIFINDWSDKRFIIFQSRGTLSMLLVGQGKTVVLVQGGYVANHGKLSPDRRYLAYWSDESGRGEVFVRPFDSALPGLPLDTPKWNVSGPGARSPLYWGPDGKELYFRISLGEVMVVGIDSAQQVIAKAPRSLFTVPARFTLAGGSISRDGTTFLFNVRVPPQRKVVELDIRTIQKYIGRYTMSDGSELVVSLEQGGLRIQRVSSTGVEEKQTLLPVGRDHFFARLADQDRDYEFEADDQGSITRVTAFFGSPRLTGFRK